jgi:hypothetical protein
MAENAEEAIAINKPKRYKENKDNSKNETSFFVKIIILFNNLIIKISMAVV